MCMTLRKIEVERVSDDDLRRLLNIVRKKATKVTLIPSSCRWAWFFSVEFKREDTASNMEEVIRSTFGASIRNETHRGYC